MARRRSNNSGGGGLLALLVIIVIIAYAGMALLMIAAIVGAIYLLCKMIAWIAKSVEESRKAKAAESAARALTPSDQNHITSGPEMQTRQIAPASSSLHLNRNEEKVRAFIREYQVEMVPYPNTQVDPIQKEMESYQCIEVLQAVNRVINQQEIAIKKLNQIKQDIDAILQCPDCDGDKERVVFLENSKSLLIDKVAEYKKIKSTLAELRILLMDKHSLAFLNVKKALTKVIESEKIVGQAGVDIRTFMKLESSLPGKMFSSKALPIELNFGAYRFFLLPEVILVFNKENEFITALEPVAMIIKSTESEKSVSMSSSGYSGGWRYNDGIISNDSVKISEGITRTSWLHEKKNGGPDLRYSHNPMYRYRTDKYRYGEISIQIGQYRANYSYSAGNISASINSMIRDYTSILHKLNATPSLLRLIESTSKKKDKAHNLLETYEKYDENVICKVE